MATFVPTVVIGGGYAGLAASHYLTLADVEHLVLERGKVGESWRTQRWDSFALNTNNRISSFPGQPYSGPNPEGFLLKDEVVSQFEQYVLKSKTPLKTGIEVASLDHGSSHKTFTLDTRSKNGEREMIDCNNVVVATGFQNKPLIPAFSDRLSHGIKQLHAADYRNPSAFPQGSVLVVGSAQSGCQIAEDLLEAGRRVFLSVSMVARVPRRYRGRDIVDWFIDSGFWDVRVEELEDPKMMLAPQPQISGVGPLGRTLSLQHLAGKGAHLVGKVAAVDEMTIYFEDNVAPSIRFADERSVSFKRMIDGYIQRKGISVPEEVPDPADAADNLYSAMSFPAKLDLDNERISTVIWCTGFGGDFGWVRLPVFDKDNRVIHRRGVSNVSGIYFLGAPWLHKRKSGVLYGMNEDAEFISQQILDKKTV